MDELHGIVALEIQESGSEIHISPKSSLKDLEQQKKDQMTLSEWLTIMKKTQSRLEAMNSGILQSRQLLSEYDKVQDPVSNLKCQSHIKIDLDDVKDEFNNGIVQWFALLLVSTPLSL